MANEVTSFAELLRANRKNGLGPLTTLSSVLSWYRGTLRRGQTSPLGLLTIQPTPFCNINCEYCYLPERNDRSTFDLNLIEPLFQKLRVAGLLGPRLAVSWHAGDPLVLPASYYSEAIERIERLRMETRITHHFQTNGMLINDEFCKLFKRANVQVALSMDGPAFIHDRRRKTRSGEGTHAKAMRGLARLNDQNISYSGIAVLSHDSLPYPDEIYDFLRNNNFRGLGLNVEEVEGFNKHTSLCHGSEELFIRFFSRMIWRAANDGDPRWLREFDQALHAVIDCIQGHPAVSSESNALSLITVDVRGRLYTFSPELAGLENGAYSIGHIIDCDFTRLWDSERFIKLWQGIERGTQLCREQCPHFKVCGGGAPINKLYENGSLGSTETLFCRLKKKIVYDVVEDFVLKTLVNERKNRLGQELH